MSGDPLEKAPDAYRTISEVAEDLDVPQHVLRFWETRFSQIRPLKRGGGRRYYRPDDVALIKGVRALLYGQGYTIKGVQRILKDQGLRYVQAIGRGEAVAPPDEASERAPVVAAPLTPAREPEPADDVAGVLDDASPIAGLDEEQRGRLKAALDELAACRRMIDAARGG